MESEYQGLTIGSKVFVVHKDYAYKNKLGSRVVHARVTAFVNKTGTVEPEFRIIGQSKNSPDLSPSHYYVYKDIKLAITAITTKHAK
jgi:hypothetical protein